MNATTQRKLALPATLEAHPEKSAWLIVGADGVPLYEVRVVLATEGGHGFPHTNAPALLAALNEHAALAAQVARLREQVRAALLLAGEYLATTPESKRPSDRNVARIFVQKIRTALGNEG